MTETMTSEEYRKLNNLPQPAHQERITLAELDARLGFQGRPGKYGNRRVELDGHTFDSQAEAERWLVLCSRQERGEIAGLEVHPRYLLQSAFDHPDTGERVRAIHYEADFAYLEQPDGAGLGKRVVEDVKGYETKVFRLKRKLFLKRYGEKYELRIIEV